MPLNSVDPPSQPNEVIPASGSSVLARMFIFGGPIGLFVAIAARLWVSSLHVEHTTTVQVETEWIVGESLAIRAQVVAEPTAPPPPAEVHAVAWVDQHGERYELPSPRPVDVPGVVANTFVVPPLRVGPAILRIRLSGLAIETREESIPIRIVEHRTPRIATPTYPHESLGQADDSDPHPPGMRIDVLVAGRWLAQFDNTVYVRTLTPNGLPYRGPVEVWLASGEFMDVRATLDTPARLVQGDTDELGVLRLHGVLSTDIARLEVRVLARDDPGRILHRRRIRLVSFAGGVRVDASPTVVAPDFVHLSVRGHSFSRKRPVFVDVHGPDGAWLATLHPPFAGKQLAREWTAEGSIAPGLLQFEAYHFTTSPGAATAVQRIHVTDRDPTQPESLDPLLAKHRDGLADPRTDRAYDAEVERRYLDWLDAAPLGPVAVATATQYLADTLPVKVFGPPTAMVTRARDLEDMDKFKQLWAKRIRGALLGGGGLFLVLMTLAMMWNQTRTAAAALKAFEAETAEDDSTAQLRQAIRSAQRQALGRSIALVLIMATALALTSFMLEHLVPPP